MNEFRLIGDGSHFVAVLILTYKLFCTKSSAVGVSWKSQFLYAATYCARYSDLFINLNGYYISSMKIFFILTAIGPIITIPWILKADYQKKFDTFWVELLILPVTALSLVVKYDDNTTLELLWTWSIYMEAVAMIPQFYMTWRGGQVDCYLITYLTGMFMYRGFYIGNWIYRYYDEAYYNWIAIGGGITETVVGLCGLIMTVIIYRLYHDSRIIYFQVNGLESVYTVPLVTSEEKGNKNGKPLTSDMDRQRLLNILDEEQNTFGPYNHQLSVPINHQERSFVA